jgi:hypothetical protein
LRTARSEIPNRATHEIAMTMNSDLSKKVRRMLGLGLDSWNNIMLFFLAVAAVAAAVVGFSTYATIQLAKQEAADSKREFDAYKLTVEGKVADAKSAGIKAGETAGNALVRAAELEKEAANAKLETEKIKQVVAWRSILPHEASSLEKVLMAKPGSVNLRWMDGDPEALFLAIQIAQLLSKAHWQVAPGAVKPPNTIMFGISLPDTNPDGQTLREAFTSAQMPFATDAVPPGIGFSISEIAGAPTLMVGSRRPPQFP